MFRNIFNWFRRNEDHRGNGSIKLSKILYNLSITDENEIACNEVHELIDQFTEMELRGEDVSRLMPLVQKHLELCPDCSEEHEILKEILEHEDRAD